MRDPLGNSNFGATMGYDRAAFKEHLDEAATADLSYYEFDSLWKAFNVYYASLHRADDPSHVDEIDLIQRAIQSIPADKRASILSQTLTTRFRRIEPIADAQMWTRFDRRMTGRHMKARRALDEVWAGAPAEAKHLEAVADVLYLVRCNMAHGHKLRYRERDTQVFEATLPILRALVA
ncbi:MAG: hypothetical protein ACREOF_04980 [Gemmatimonadales bacterium]